MNERVLQLRKCRRRADAGAKARTLARIASLGFAVPDGFVIPPDLLDHGTRSDRLESSLAGLLDDAAVYAVRSSASVEDGTEHSWAGQFRTHLNVPAAQVSEAARDVATSGAHAVYDRDAPHAPREPDVAVIVQRMVDARAAGVVFSRNPVTGVKETVIETVTGTAEELVAGRRKPERWVRKHGEWVVQPDAAVLPVSVAHEIASGAERMEAALGWPVDAEWAWDGTVWWLQARPVTTGTRQAVYSSRMARDMLPGIILPLVWSVNGPSKSRVFLRFLEDVFGPLDVRAEDLGTLIHHRFYINIGALSRLFAEFGLPEDSLERLAGMERGAGMPGMPWPTLTALRRFPHIGSAVLRYSRFDRELDRELPGLWRRSREFAGDMRVDALDASGLLKRIDELEPLVEQTTFHHMVTLMVMQMYAMRLRGRLQRKGFLGKGEPLDIPALKRGDHDVTAALEELTALARSTPQPLRGVIASGDLGSLRADPDARELVDALDGFLSAFGHLSDSGVNFASTPWSEQPEAVLRIVAAALDIPAREAPAAGDHERARITRAAGRAWSRVAAYTGYRDETSSLYTYTYGLYRPLIRALGERLRALGALKDGEDVLYLTLDEVRRVAEGALAPDEARAITAHRAADVEASSAGEPPEVVVGDVAELVTMPDRAVFRGIPASRGTYTGRVTLCRGLADLERIAPGDVVVVPYSDASWTPLFRRAGAIVAESGGLLSHSAILARELGVPALTSVRGALGLRNGSLVSVDGFIGTVTVLEPAT